MAVKTTATKTAHQSILAYEAKLLTGQVVELTRWEGQVLLFVNTASFCGFAPQFKELEWLQQEYQDRGFSVLAWPSRQFLQEYGSDEAVQSHCDRKLNLSFPLFSMSKVRGKDAHPVWQALAATEHNGKPLGGPKWNFCKYLVDRKGNAVRKFAPSVKPTSPKIIQSLEVLL